MAVQSLFHTTYPIHLDGSYASASEKLNAGVNTFSNIPLSRFGVGISKKVLSASMFNSLHKGTGTNATKASGFYIRQYNNTIKNKAAFKSAYSGYNNILSITSYMNERYNH